MLRSVMFADHKSITFLVVDRRDLTSTLDLQLSRLEMLGIHPELETQHTLCQLSLIDDGHLLHVLDSGTGAKSPDHLVRSLPR